MAKVARKQNSHEPPKSFYELRSSVIDWVIFDEKTNLLEVRFTTGRHYFYYGVPKSVVVDMLLSPSKGKFYNRHIKEIYPSKRYE